MNRKQLKALEGKQIFLVPTGNNVYRGKPMIEQVQGYTLYSVARVNASIVRFDRQVKFKIADNKENLISLNDGCNGGYIVFKTKDDAMNHLKAIALAREISDAIRFRRPLSELSLESLKQIADIIGVNHE